MYINPSGSNLYLAEIRKKNENGHSEAKSSTHLKCQHFVNKCPGITLYQIERCYARQTPSHYRNISKRPRRRANPEIRSCVWVTEASPGRGIYLGHSQVGIPS